MSKKEPEMGPQELADAVGFGTGSVGSKEPTSAYWDKRLLDVLHKQEAQTPSPRGALLDEAKHLVTGDRNNQYGPPTQDFQRAADILTALGYTAINGRKLEPHDIALMVMAVKMSRLTWMPSHEDSWTDIAGYAGCGYECAVEESLNLNNLSARHPLT